MTPERIEELRKLADALRRSSFPKDGQAMAECLDEIERLQIALKISSSKEVAHVAMQELDAALAENDRLSAEVAMLRSKSSALQEELNFIRSRGGN